ncbi:MAG TPA: alkaline phosphatase family protein [Thermoanaerobaculia bacterium]|nr:alkaline phosphatase family protein [Thermoanaerobaculia bacterium]
MQALIAPFNRPARRLIAALAQRFALAALAALAAAALLGGRPALARHPSHPYLRTAAGGLEGIPRFSHIVLLVLENESFATTWGSGSVATYLNGLRSQGVLADHYYATGHQSLDNYIAMVSGQPVQPATAADCEALNLYDCVQGQSLMAGGRNLADQIEDAGLGWKGYMDAMPSACFHADYSPTAAPQDPYQGNSTTPPAFNYADRHNPFLYFAGIVGNDSRCQAHVEPYAQLAADLAGDSLPAFSFIAPDTCHDGHDNPCADGSAGGLARADLWLSQNVPALLTYLLSHNGLLLITFDEASTTDTSGCCTGGPGGGQGAGGRVGLLALSAAVPAGGVVSTPYDHASLLRTIEDSLGIAEHLNNAGTATPMAGLFTVATRLLVSAPAAQPAGSPFTINVAALDDAGHVATNYSGTVHFASGDAAAILPADYTFTGNGGDGGIHSFTGAALLTTGAQSLAAADLAKGTISGGAVVTVTPPMGGAANFFTVKPCRVADTRGPAGPYGAPALAGSGPRRDFSLAGRCGVPAGASAVAANLTVVSPSGAGFLNVDPTGTPATGTSILNFRAGAVRSNNAVLSLLGSPAGSVSVQAGAFTGQTDFVLDVSGYFQPGPPPLPPPALSGIDHIVLVMMENRSFDHFLGWLPGADGKQGGLSYADSAGGEHPTHELAPDFQGCAFLDPGHSYGDGRVQYDGGACDGWQRDGSDAAAAAPAQANDPFAVGYYAQADLAFFGNAAPAWTVGDRYFAGIMAETYPNRFLQHAAATDRLVNTTAIASLPTIWDRLAQAGVTGTYYYGDVPFLALWGSKYAAISQPFSQFLAAAAAGTLPAVAFVDPRFEDESSGTSGDDHPHADVRNGEAFLNQIYDAVRSGPNWASTVLVINFDEWGGFFDHVPPPTAPIPAATASAGDVDGRLGFRVPLLVISPFARRGFVSHEVFDHTSILRMIEWRFSLKPLTVRDATANNLADVLDFANPQLASPTFSVPAGPFGAVCGAAALTRDTRRGRWGADPPPALGLRPRRFGNR